MDKNIQLLSLIPQWEPKYISMKIGLKIGTTYLRTISEEKKTIGFTFSSIYLYFQVSILKGIMTQFVTSNKIVVIRLDFHLFDFNSIYA